MGIVGADIVARQETGADQRTELLHNGRIDCVDHSVALLIHIDVCLIAKSVPQRKGFKTVSHSLKHCHTEVNVLRLVLHGLYRQLDIQLIDFSVKGIARDVQPLGRTGDIAPLLL